MAPVTCNKCGSELHCPCKHCQKTDPQPIAYIWVTGEGPIRCPVCGDEKTVEEFYEQDEE